MSAEEVARAHYEARRRLTSAVGDVAAQQWQRVHPSALDASWAGVAPTLMVVVAGAQLAAARVADRYVGDALDAQGLSPDTSAPVEPGALSGIASDGRRLDDLLVSAIFAAKIAVAGGATSDRAMASGLATLDMIVRTQVADAGRVADQVALVTRRQAGGYTRMVVGKTCSRCLILAGRWYRWNAGFDRHPRCDCVGIPCDEDRSGDLRTDPKKAFESMTAVEQDKVFTAAGAQAIRDGADVAKVVNARRGMQTAADGRLYTTEAAGRRPRLMPEQIYREANGSRDEALRLLQLHGYIR